jgi:succinate dehydrogenase / fumarate reductase cytochrome b subunit
MSDISRVSLVQALRYRGGQSMLAWLLHRISGIGIVLFVSMHIVAAFYLYSVEPESITGQITNALTNFYESLPMQIFMLFAVLWHAINGLRIVVLDMWPAMMAYNREAMWVQWALFIPLFLLPSSLMIIQAFSGA